MTGATSKGPSFQDIGWDTKYPNHTMNPAGYSQVVLEELEQTIIDDIKKGLVTMFDQIKSIGG